MKENKRVKYKKSGQRLLICWIYFFYFQSTVQDFTLTQSTLGIMSYRTLKMTKINVWANKIFSNSHKLKNVHMSCLNNLYQPYSCWFEIMLKDLEVTGKKQLNKFFKKQLVIHDRLFDSWIVSNRFVQFFVWRSHKIPAGSYVSQHFWKYLEWT